MSLNQDLASVKLKWNESLNILKISLNIWNESLNILNGSLNILNLSLNILNEI